MILSRYISSALLCSGVIAAPDHRRRTATDIDYAVATAGLSNYMLPIERRRPANPEEADRVESLGVPTGADNRAQGINYSRHKRDGEEFMRVVIIEGLYMPNEQYEDIVRRFRGREHELVQIYCNTIIFGIRNRGVTDIGRVVFDGTWGTVDPPDQLSVPIITIKTNPGSFSTRQLVEFLRIVGDVLSDSGAHVHYNKVDNVFSDIGQDEEDTENIAEKFEGLGRPHI